jgi:hypothetical protein
MHCAAATGWRSVAVATGARTGLSHCDWSQVHAPHCSQVGARRSAQREVRRTVLWLQGHGRALQSQPRTRRRCPSDSRSLHRAGASEALRSSGWHDVRHTTAVLHAVYCARRAAMCRNGSHSALPARAARTHPWPHTGESSPLAAMRSLPACRLLSVHRQWSHDL